MPWFWWLIAGLLIGWVIKWVIDWVYWRGRMRSYSETTTTLQTEVQTLRSGRDKLDRDMQELRGQYDQSVAGMNTLRAEYDQSVAGMNTLRAEYDQSQGLVARLHADNERVADELAEARAQAGQLADLRVERDALAADMLTLRQNGDHAEHTIASLRTDVDQLRHNLAEARKLEEQLSLAHAERDGIAAKLAELQGIRERNAAEIEALHAQTQAIADARDESQREVMTLRAAPMQQRERSGLQLGITDRLESGASEGLTFGGTSFESERNSFTLGNSAAVEEVPMTGGGLTFDGDGALAVSSTNERDPLIDVNGIGPVYQQKLFDAGVFSFAQLAAMTPERLREIVSPQSWQEIEPELWIVEAREFAAQRGGRDG